MTKITSLLVFAALAVPGLAVAQSEPPPTSVASMPRLSLSVGFNGPQYWTAEFPGLAFAVAVNRPNGETAGVALVGELDLSYARLGTTAGVRLYARRPHGFGRPTVFVQTLVGAVTGATEGIIHSTGGLAVLPGAGFTLGHFIAQLDYRYVRNGNIHDGGLRDPIDTGMSGKRITIGYIWALKKR